MTGDTAAVVGSAVAAVATGRIKFALDFVQGDVVAPVRELAVRAIAIFAGRFQFSFVGVTVAAE
jgi:hypothetical protein